MALRSTDWPPEVLALLRKGVVIPAHPLALDVQRKLDPRRQRALTRYYLDAGAGGLAVGVHTTQFAIRTAGLFEPAHGLSPKYAGQHNGKPVAMLLTAKLMFDWLKEAEMATRLENAIARVIKEGKVRTYDMGGSASTLDVAKAVADYSGR
jgi:hypothetical protein